MAVPRVGNSNAEEAVSRGPTATGKALERGGPALVAGPRFIGAFRARP